MELFRINKLLTSIQGGPNALKKHFRKFASAELSTLMNIELEQSAGCRRPINVLTLSGSTASQKTMASNSSVNEFEKPILIMFRQIPHPPSASKVDASPSRPFSPPGGLMEPFNAISWFFSFVKASIILEDDCVPHPFFLTYCRALLEHYRNDSRIWNINGSNFAEEFSQTEASSFFIGYATTWTWATWRRYRKAYATEMKVWPTLRRNKSLIKLHGDSERSTYWSKIREIQFYTNQSDACDFKPIFTCMTNAALTADPKIDLVNTIDFGEDAARAIIPFSTAAKLTTSDLHYIIFPSLIARNRNFKNIPLKRTCQCHALTTFAHKLGLQLFYTPKRLVNKVTRRQIDAL